jgi:hypothetical protein
MRSQRAPEVAFHLCSPKDIAQFFLSAFESAFSRCRPIFAQKRMTEPCGLLRMVLQPGAYLSKLRNHHRSYNMVNG